MSNSFRINRKTRIKHIQRKRFKKNVKTTSTKVGVGALLITSLSNIPVFADVNNDEENKNIDITENITNENFDNNGGIILTHGELNSNKLNDPKRNYCYSFYSDDDKVSVVSVENIDNKYDFVRLENDKKVKYDSSYIKKFIAIHETDNTSPSAYAMQNVSALTQKNYTATFFIDQDTVVQTMDFTGCDNALGYPDNEKTGMTNENTISMELCVPEGGDYHRTVAVAICQVRKLLQEMPDLQISNHASAYTERYNGESVQKNCPRKLLAGEDWWTWDKFVFFATHPEYGVPFLDYNPLNENEIPKDKEVRIALGLEEDTNKIYEASLNSDNSTTSDSINKENESTSDMDNLINKNLSNDSENMKNKENNNISTNNKSSSNDDLEDLSLDEMINIKISKSNIDIKQNVKDALLHKKSNLDLQINNNELANIHKYVPLNINKNFNFIKSNSNNIKYSDAELKDMLRQIDEYCKVERVNPNVIVQFMNAYTGYLSFNGSITSDMYNFSGLKNNKGEYITYSTEYTGLLAMVQYFKALTSSDKMNLTCYENDAINGIQKGQVYYFEEFANVLNVNNSEEFIETVANLLNKINTI